MSSFGNVFFAVCATLALASAIGTVTLRSPLRAAVALLFHIIALAGLYLTLHAHLLAALQLLVYAGAIVVLFVFVIMLLGAGAVTRGTYRGLIVRSLGAGVMALVTAALVMVALSVQSAPRAIAYCDEARSPSCAIFGGVRAVARELFGQRNALGAVDGAVIPFELVSVLLLVAVVGVIAVAKGRRVPAGDK
ncbi:MAG: NADH-quinone oxidoreductase subunit J [Myxococcales bacterium]|nr:NADH-quinone oxidoreductase subunit J [Myxococcales bacterium]